jgi:DNA-directed RNA polymerase specialized sigma subunit
VIKRTAKRAKLETGWYDVLCQLYQDTKITELRNILWEQVKNLVYGRVHAFIRRKKFSVLADKELCKKIFDDSFLIFIKATEIWDKNRKTKFLTFLGDILDQEILNIIRLDRYHKSRDKKLEGKLKKQVVDEPIKFFSYRDQEKEEILGEFKELFESFSFKSKLERDIIYTMVYGKMGDWTKLRKESKMSVGKFAKIRQQISIELKEYILEKSSPRMKDVLKEILEEK